MPAKTSIPQSMLPALRSDHAGETGAVQIYRGILAVTRLADVRNVARHHLATEQRHLQLMDDILPTAHRSRLQVWRGQWQQQLTCMAPAAQVWQARA